VLAAEPAHLPQYVGMFALGIVAYRGDWLRRLPTPMGMIWLFIGVAASAGVFAAQLAPERVPEYPALGGLNWRSLLYSICEAAICVGVIVGMIVLFRTVFRRTNRLLVAMVAVGYAAYILHLAIVIGLQFSIEGIDLPVLAKFGFVTGFGVLVSFGLGLLSQRIPGLRIVLGTRPSMPANEAVPDGAPE